MTDYICPSCGQKALPVATRCPRCGLAIEGQFMAHQLSAPKPGRRRLLVVVATALVVIAIASLFQQPRTPRPESRMPQAPPVVVDSTPAQVTAAAPDPVHRVNDSTVPAPVAAAPTESVTPRVDSIPPTLPAPAAEPAAEPAIPHGAVRRYAGTWVNVRSGRDNRAAVIRILHPGDPVIVDSLVRGWYRVIARGEAVGYLDRRLLDTVPSATRP